MDIASVIGLALGLLAVVGGFMMEGGRIAALFVLSAAVIVFAGSAGATILSFSLKHTLNIPNVMRLAFFPKHTDRLQLLRQIVQMAKRARRSGILTLEAEAKTIENSFLRQGIQLVVDGMSPELVREILEIELDAMRHRHKLGAEFFGIWGGYAPTLGVLGTVMGLIHMLESLNDPGTMGPAIATAFIATFYGVGFANLVLLPVKAKLQLQSQEETTIYEMAIEGMLSLQAGDNPSVVTSKMRPYLPMVEKIKLDTEEVV